MPFRGLMLLPTELTLRTTKDGIRVLSKPIAEVASLLKPLYSSEKALNEQEANAALDKALPLKRVGGAHLRATLNLTYATSAGLRMNGQNIIDYDLNRNTLNGQFYSPQDPTSLSLTMDVYIDCSTVEVFIDDGLYSFSMQSPRPPLGTGKAPKGLEFWGTDISVSDLRLDAIESIWQ